ATAVGWFFGIGRIGSFLAPTVVGFMLAFHLGQYVLHTLCPSHFRAGLSDRRLRDPLHRHRNEGEGSRGHRRNRPAGRTGAGRAASPGGLRRKPAGGTRHLMAQEKSEIRDGIRIDWDVPLCMADGVTLRADVFRPTTPGVFPVILSHGPYGKGLPFQQGNKAWWERLTASHPEVAAGSTNKYQNWE